MFDIILITAISFFGKLIEDCRKLGLAPKGAGKPFADLCCFYECLNIHLSLSLGMLGMVLAIDAGHVWILIMVLMTLAGVVSKGVFSGHEPDRLTWRDRDALWGIYVPNGLAIGTVFIAFVLVAAPTPPNGPKQLPQTKSIETNTHLVVNGHTNLHN